MAKLTDSETLIEFKKWLRKELSSPDVDYAFVIDQVGGALYQIQEFGGTSNGGISHKKMQQLIHANKQNHER